MYSFLLSTVEEPIEYLHYTRAITSKYARYKNLFNLQANLTDFEERRKSTG